jgi:glycosyltransferase involved in cell wall biosynthesis
MRVLLISHTCQSQTEGQPKADCLARLPGIDLCVLVPRRWKRYGQWRDAEPPISDAFRFEVGRVCWPWLGKAQTYMHWYPRLGRLLRDFQPDVIDVWEEPWSLVSAQVCALRNRYLPAARIITETEQNINKRLPPPFEWFRRYTLRHADYAVGRSREAVAVLRDKGYAGPAEVVPNAVDAQRFKPMPRSEARRLAGFGGLRGPVVGYVGRLVQAKGVADLIESIGLAHEPMQLLLVGSGPDEAAFRDIVHARELDGRVHFLGSRTPDQLPRLINALDVLVLPSRTTPSWKEQFGRVLIEAHACAVPVVGSDSGGIPDVVGEGGLVVPERDPRALAEALDRLVSDRVEAQRIGRLGYEQVHANCTWQRVAERMHAIYRKASGHSVDDAPPTDFRAEHVIG